MGEATFAKAVIVFVNSLFEGEKNKGIHVSTTEQKLFTALHFFHMLSCYIPNGLNSFSALKFYTQCPIMAM